MSLCMGHGMARGDLGLGAGRTKVAFPEQMQKRLLFPLHFIPSLLLLLHFLLLCVPLSPLAPEGDGSEEVTDDRTE